MVTVGEIYISSSSHLNDVLFKHVEGEKPINFLMFLLFYYESSLCL